MIDLDFNAQLIHSHTRVDENAVKMSDNQRWRSKAPNLNWVISVVEGSVWVFVVFSAFIVWVIR